MKPALRNGARLSGRLRERVVRRLAAGRLATGWLAAGALLALPHPGFAQAVGPDNAPGAPSVQQNPVPGGNPRQVPTTMPAPGLWQRSQLLGNMGGLRPALGSLGLSLGALESDEVFGNATGGTRRGADYDGITELSLGLDTGTAFGWPGGTLNVSAFQIHGRNLSTDDLLTLQTASGLEAQRATRLWELWFTQSLFGGRADIKLGQQSLDQEFITSAGSSLFLNTAMGWPLVPSVDLYAGGPAYPLSSLGVRLRGQLSDAITVLGGVFDDNPAGGPFYDDSQTRGAAQSGTRFSTGTGGLVIGELQYQLNPPPGQPAASGQPNSGSPPPGNASPGLPGAYKIGFWYDSGAFPDQRFDQHGLSLADRASDGVAALHRGNYSLYAVADQMIWRPGPQAARAVGLFARVMGTPDGNRNLADLSLNAGITLKAPLPGRDNDTLGLAYGLARISGAAAALDQDRILQTGVAQPVRGSESLLELTYQAQLVPWWIVQPDLQYVFTPGGGIADPLRPGQRIGNELVLGLRSNVTF